MKASILFSALCMAWVSTQASLPASRSSKSTSAESPHLPVWKRRQTKHLRPVVEKREVPEPNTDGRGAPEDEGQNIAIELQNPSALNPPPTDGGMVPNLKWSFALSNTLKNKGGYIREQLESDLPPSTDFAGAQNHLTKGSIRQMHWHSCSEWGYVTNGTVSISMVDNNGRNQVENATAGDIWFFPKGQPHVIQGLEDSNEYLLIFDTGDFANEGVTFNVDDWLIHTPAEVLLKNFGLDNTSTAFDHVDPSYGSINTGRVADESVDSPFGQLTGNASWYFPASKMEFTQAPGGGGSYKRVDSTNFPVSQKIVGQIVQVKPRGMREMHWHPNGVEWLYFQSGTARATVWWGAGNARTFDFTSGDTAVFPDNSGHYIENTSDTDDLFYLEIFNSDVVEDVSLTQWLALTPPDLVSQVLNVSIDVVKALPKEKQVILAAKP
ncbi:Bicupin, oxalate decarboxylase/oxidase [Xylaria telfairii]|nr:Bicupin, oxalate decarboxylase/oxidase [Xylaria telfairii]